MYIYLEPTEKTEGIEQIPVYKIWIFYSYPNMRLFKGYIATNDVQKAILKYSHKNEGKMTDK